MSSSLRAMKHLNHRNKTKDCSAAGNPESPFSISHFCLSLFGHLFHYPLVPLSYLLHGLVENGGAPASK